jgi:hypothetical protein
MPCSSGYTVAAAAATAAAAAAAAVLIDRRAIPVCDAVGDMFGTLARRRRTDRRVGRWSGTDEYDVASTCTVVGGLRDGHPEQHLQQNGEIDAAFTYTLLR